MSAISTSGVREGRVDDYDEVAGYGHLAEVAEGGAGARWWFHCTAIVDGSRTIAVGTPVRFQLAPGHLGRYEAIAITPTGDASGAA